MTRIGTLLEKIEYERANQLDQIVEEWVNHRLQVVRTRLNQVIGTQSESTWAYETWVLDYIKDEFGALDERDTPLCGCRTRCPLKRGELPTTVATAESIDRGIQRYKHRHPARPHVLMEAYDAFQSELAWIESELERIKTTIVRNELPADVSEAEAREAIGAIDDEDADDDDASDTDAENADTAAAPAED